MAKRETGAEAYVRRVREQTQRYVERLLKENERLRLVTAAAGAEHVRLTEEINAARQKLAHFEAERNNLQDRLGEVEAENHVFVEQYLDVEQQNSNLAKLYAASYRLHGTLDRAEVLGAIQEIIANLVGSEEVAIFELEAGGLTLSLIASHGIDPSPYRHLAVGQGRIGQTAQSGEIFLAHQGSGNGDLPEEKTLTACIPLKLDDRVIGVISIFRLLPQKEGLESLDRQLFELLGTHAAAALYCTGFSVGTGRVTT